MLAGYFVPICVVAAILFVMLLAHLRAAATLRRRLEWASIGAQFGLEPSSPELLAGKTESLLITVDGRLRFMGHLRILIRIRIRDVPSGLSLSTRARTLPLFMYGAFRIQDPGFDRALVVRHEEAWVRAALTGPVRDLLRRMAGRAVAFSIEGGWLSYETIASDNLRELEERLDEAISIGQACTFARGEVPLRLAANARGDDLPEVRIRCLETLAIMYGTSRLTRETALALLVDEEPELRLAAARRCADDDLDALLAVAANELDPRARVGLLKYLGSFAGDRAWPLIEAALASDDDAVVCAAADAARATDYALLAPRIATKIETNASSAGTKVLVACARALAAFAVQSTESALIRLISHESRDVQRAGAEALAEFGSVVAVEPLLLASQQLVLGGETRSALLAAVARIQARLGNAEAGALSVSAPEPADGALSLADDSGALSLLGEEGSPKLRR